MTKYDIINPIWDNKEKTRIKCQIIITNPDGSETKHIASISKGSGDWNLIMKKYGQDYVDEKTVEITEKVKKDQAEKLEKRKENSERSKERMRLESLFTRKLEIFEIEEVKNSTNKEIKAKIRKAKTETEALVYAAKLVSDQSE